MLILTRRMGEVLRIGDSITITVLNVAGNNVSIGIEAPLDIKIIRKELLENKEPTRRRGIFP
jgi:carbon storage regulator